MRSTLLSTLTAFFFLIIALLSTIASLPHSTLLFLPRDYRRRLSSARLHLWTRPFWRSLPRLPLPLLSTQYLATTTFTRRLVLLQSSLTLPTSSTKYPGVLTAWYLPRQFQIHRLLSQQTRSPRDSQLDTKTTRQAPAEDEDIKDIPCFTLPAHQPPTRLPTHDTRATSHRSCCTCPPDHLASAILFHPSTTRLPPVFYLSLSCPTVPSVSSQTEIKIQDQVQGPRKNNLAILVTPARRRTHTGHHKHNRL